MPTPQFSPLIYDPSREGHAECKWLAQADTPPPWRTYAPKSDEDYSERIARHIQDDHAYRGESYKASQEEAQIVSAALLLRRPILVTGDAGVGKSSLPYAVAWKLGLGSVLKWGITSRSTLKEALYQYDAIARLQDASLLESEQKPRSRTDIGKYITLGPLGTALLPTRTSGYFPRVLLIDEIDKSDADLPSDLLHVLEEGSFLIPEIARLYRSASHGTPSDIEVSTLEPSMQDARVPVSGHVRCDDFPLIFMTSNGERDFPPAFLRRCLRLKVEPHSKEKLKQIVVSHFSAALAQDPTIDALLTEFSRQSETATLATDQLLNIIHIVRHSLPGSETGGTLRKSLLQSLSESPSYPS